MTSHRNLRRRRQLVGVYLDEAPRITEGLGRLSRVEVAPADGSGPWRPLAGVRDWSAEAPVAAPLSPWQREKLRQAMQQALLLARWVMHR